MNLTPQKQRALEVFFLYTTYFLAICVPLGIWKMVEIFFHILGL